MEQQNCKELTDLIIGRMTELGYSYTTIHRRINYVYRALVRYCNTEHNGMYSREAGVLFLESIEDRLSNVAKSTQSVYCNAIRRADAALEGNFDWYNVSKKRQEYELSCFSEILSDYEAYLYKTGKTVSDVRARCHVLAHFLKSIEEQEVMKLGDIRTEHIYKAFEASNSKAQFTKSVRSFLKYLYKSGYCEADISDEVPRKAGHKPVPTVYREEEIDQLIGSVDLNRPAGRRDLAILLVAARLGLRSSDIAGMRLSDIDFEKKKISVEQKKTKQMIVLPLRDDIENALKDYLENGRPASKTDHVFVKVQPPIGDPMQPHTVYSIMARLFRRSGIDTAGRRKGAHSLRSSLASNLLSRGISCPEISQVLGHTSYESARYYVRVDLKNLYDFALEVIPASDGLMNYLSSGGKRE